MGTDMDLELERIEEEIRRHDEKRKRLVERKNRRMRQIREKQLKDKEAWMKKFIPLLDKAMEEKLGTLYWYSTGAEDICAGVRLMEIAAGRPETSGLEKSEKKKEDCKREGTGRDEYH